MSGIYLLYVLSTAHLIFHVFIFRGSNIAVDIKIQVTAPMASDNPKEDRRPPPPMSPAANVPTLRKTGVGPMMRPLGEAMMERQRSEMATHVSKFTTKFRKRSNTR